MMFSVLELFGEIYIYQIKGICANKTINLMLFTESNTTCDDPCLLDNKGFKYHADLFPSKTWTQIVCPPAPAPASLLSEIFLSIKKSCMVAVLSYARVEHCDPNFLQYLYHCTVS